MLKTLVTASLLAFAGAAGAATLAAPAAGADATGFRHTHADRYLTGKDDIDVYADVVDNVPAYVFVQRSAAGKIAGSAWVATGSGERLKSVFGDLQRERAGVRDMETHDILACTSMGARAVRVHEQHIQKSDGSMLSFNTTPGFAALSITTGTGTSGELRPFPVQEFDALLGAAYSHLSDYAKKWTELFKAENSAAGGMSLPPFCDSRPFAAPTDQTFPLVLGKPLSDPSITEGPRTIEGSYTVFGVKFPQVAVKVSGQKTLESASYEGDDISDESFKAITTEVNTRFGDPFLRDHATQGDAATDTWAYRDTATKSTVLVIQLLKRSTTDKTGHLRIATRLPA
jgi:hypothetical protein